MRHACPVEVHVGTVCFRFYNEAYASDGHDSFACFASLREDSQSRQRISRKVAKHAKESSIQNLTHLQQRLLLFSILLTFSFVTENVGAASPQATDPVHTIRRQYATINKNQAKYKTVKKELSGFSAEGGKLVAHFDGRSITKLVATYYGETGKAQEEYYYWDGHLIFVFHKEFTYDKPLSGKVVRTGENRFYFNNDKLIKWIDENGNDIAPVKTEYVEKQNEYLKSSTQFTAGSRSPKSIIEAID
jgi:hypothetical protein